MQPDDGQSCRGQRFQTGQECRFYRSYQSDPLKKQRKRTDSPKQDDHRHIEDRPSVQACRDLPALGDQGQGEPADEHSHSGHRDTSAVFYRCSGKQGIACRADSSHESPEEPPRCELHVSGLSASGEKPDTKQRQKNTDYGPFIRCCPCGQADIDCDKYNGEVLDHRCGSGIRPFDGAEVRVLAERQTRNGKQNDLYKPFFVFSKFFQIQTVLRKRKKQQYDPR